MISLGIETTNEGVSVALFDGEAVREEAFSLPIRQGDLGVRPQDALYELLKETPRLLECIFCDPKTPQKAPQNDPKTPRNGPKTSQKTSQKTLQISAIATTSNLIGASIARCISAANAIPLLQFSHTQAHIASNLLSNGAFSLLEQRVFIVHLDRTTTAIYQNIPFLELKELGRTEDLTAGRLLDRVGLMIKHAVPAGAALDELAQNGTLISGIKATHHGAHGSFGEIEHHARYMYERGACPADVSLYVLVSIAVTVEAMLQSALLLYEEEQRNAPVVFCGGVCASQILQKLLYSRISGAIFPTEDYARNHAGGLSALAFAALH